MVKKILSLNVIVCFFLTTLGPLPKAHADSVLGLPAAGTMINLSPAYEPVIIRGLTVHKDNPFLFDFIVDVGQDRMSGEPLKKEGEKLIKYFLASLAIPDKNLWVNLSPYEKNRMIPEVLGQTDMGRDLLEQDYVLKQITASLIYPEKQLGKTFWDKVYAKAQEMYGTTQVPVNTFNKVWIMADKAEVFEHNQTAFVVGCHLKVMLEEDYLALNKQTNKQTNDASLLSKTHTIGSQIVREVILPQLEKEVNTGKNFANLRQIFNSVILSAWYKKNLKEALLNQVYADKSKVKGINLSDPTVKQQIYEQYLKAYKKGVFNYIKEDINTANGVTIPRKYFSGGTIAAVTGVEKVITDPVLGDAALLAEGWKDDREVDLQTEMMNTNPQSEAQAGNSSAAMLSDASFSAYETKDSRGKPTVEFELTSHSILGSWDDITVTGDVPAGASKGEEEAKTVSVAEAISNIQTKIMPMLQNANINLMKHEDLIRAEEMMIAAAGDNFKIFGANATLPVSRALWEMAARLHGMSVAKYIRTFVPEAVYDEGEGEHGLSLFYLNIFNGGLHALKPGEQLGVDRIDAQEIMIVPVGAKTHAEQLEIADKIDFELKNILVDKYGADTVTRGDESGFTVKGLGDTDTAIDHVVEAIEKAGYTTKQVRLAFDIAAGSFFDKKSGMYKFKGELRTTEWMINYYVELRNRLEKKYGINIIYTIEDGLFEEDWDGWVKLTQQMKPHGTGTVGDDLFVTQGPRLQKGITLGAATHILIKQNQNGTMWGTLQTIAQAKKAGMRSIISHRSGETLNTQIAAIAYATRSNLKTGDPEPDYDFTGDGQYATKIKVRRPKYEEVIRLEQSPEFANAGMLSDIRISYPADQDAFNKTMDRAFGERIKEEDSDKRLEGKTMILGTNAQDVVSDAVGYFKAIPPNDVARRWFYEWIQHHQSYLSANIIADIGLDSYVPFMLDVLKEIAFEGNPDGNPRSAARQIIEIAQEGTVGGYPVPGLQQNAQKLLGQHRTELENLASYIPVPQFPQIVPGQKIGKLLLVRHAETWWNEPVYDPNDPLFNQWAGWYGGNPTPKGAEETFKRGEELKPLNDAGVHFDYIVSSDLPRAQETMRLFLAGMGIKAASFETASSLREKHYGWMAGWRRSFVEKIFGTIISNGENLYNFWRRAPNGRAPGGEDLNDVKERVGVYFVNEILPRLLKGENVMISAHGNSLRAIITILEEHNRGQLLGDNEIKELEVPQAQPIAVTFGDNLKANIYWSKFAKKTEIGQEVGISGVIDALKNPAMTIDFNFYDAEHAILSVMGSRRNITTGYVDPVIMAIANGVNGKIRDHRGAEAPTVYAQWLNWEGTSRTISRVQQERIADAINGILASKWANRPAETQRPEDKAALATVIKPDLNGGIDLSTSSGMQWKDSKDGNGVEMNVNPAMLARIQHDGINWLEPVVLKMTLVTSIWPLVGLQASVK